MVALCDSKECTGCFACYNSCNKGAISICRDNFGFNVPHIDLDKCVECGICQKSCPVLTPPLPHSYSPVCYAAYALDNSIRMTSSSGGLFGVFAIEIISKGGVVYGACFDDNMHLCHSRAETVEELHKLQGSKYTQSYVGNIFKSVKKDLSNPQKEVLFVGTPCQIAGLKKFLKKTYSNLYLVDILCHGVTSPGLFEKYIHNNFGEDVVIDYQFRDYETQRLDCIVTFKEFFNNSYKTNKRRVFGDASCYLSLFQKGLAFRESCYECKFNKIPRQGDVTLGDFWGIGKKTPYIPPQKKGGTSFVLINNEVGNKLLESIKNQIYFEERAIEEAVIQNPNIVKPSERPEEQIYFWDDFISLSPRQLIEKYHLEVFKKPLLIKRVSLFLKRIIKL